MSNLKSGFFVSLIAFPLCLGISISSGFPPFAGLITAIVGSFVVMLLGGSRLTIKGPAAGLIVIVLGAVTELGQGDAMLGYKRALAVGVAAAVLQIIVSRFPVWIMNEIIPSNVVHGMLSGIGGIIIIKQAFVLMGTKPIGKSSLQMLSSMPEAVKNINPEIFFVGLLSLGVMVLWNFSAKWPKVFKKIPPAILAIGLSILVGKIFDFEHPHAYDLFQHVFAIVPEHLITVPSNILQSINFPDFSLLSTMMFWKHVTLFFLIGSMESLLTVSAIDKMDPLKMKSDSNRDLLSLGVANLVACGLGGLPMISEIVRSKANIDYGAENIRSNFFHGVFILAFVLFFPNILHLIPMATLAALLVFTGYRLLSPKYFMQSFKVGMDQFLPFIITFSLTVFADLLLGIACGVAAQLLYFKLIGVKGKEFFSLRIERDDQNKEQATFKVNGPLLFTNFFRLRKQIELAQKDNGRCLVEVSDAPMIEHSVLAQFSEMQADWSDDGLIINGIDSGKKGISRHSLATRYRDRNRQKESEL